MNKRTLLATLMAMSMIGGPPALAQRDDRHDGRGGGPPGHRPDEHRPDEHRQDRRHDERRPYEHRPDAPRAHPGFRSHGDAPGDRGAGPEHAFRRGDHLPLYYRHPRYVVLNWRYHHLAPPPRGYHWVQTGGDFVLVAIATGIILQLLLIN